MQKTKEELGIPKAWINPPTHNISILLPTRKRCEPLKKSLESLFDLAHYPGKIELLLGLDDDDSDTMSWIQENIFPYLESHGVSATIISFTPMGYINLNHYVNALGKIANGNWLMFWNDDAIMQTKHWDDQIIQHDGRFVVQRMPTHNCHPYAIFPIVPRDWLYLLGYLSNHQLTDATISQIAYMLNIMVNIDVEVLHDRHDLTGNNGDEIYQNRPMLEGNIDDPRDFNHTTFRQARLNDCNKIAWYLDRIGQPTQWFREVLLGKQDPWEIMMNEENDPNRQLRQWV